MDNLPRLLHRIWDHLAPVKPIVPDTLPVDTVPEAPVPPPLTSEEYAAQALAEQERIKVIHDAEIIKLEAEAEYLERRKRVQARLDALNPPRRGTTSATPTTAGSKGKKQSMSLAARIWRRIPLKPIVIPFVFVGIVLIIYARAC